ncbi:MAG: DUF4124 domain-containing protein [Betaproteobacteria bacterium]
MKKSLFVFLLGVSTFYSYAEIYKSVDPGGRIIYSDAPPPPENSSVSIVNTTAPVKAGQATDWEAKDRDLRKRMMVKDGELAKENLTVDAAIKACDSARATIKGLENIYGRHAFRRDSNGERVYITDEERSTIESDAQQSIAKNCK